MTQKPTVLIVDDSPMMCSYLGLFLEKRFEVLTYTDSVEALTLVMSGFQPDLIVTDLDMPGLNGIALIQAIRKALPNVPLLVVSGAKDSSERIKALSVGADDLMSKPFHPSELDVRLNKLIERSEIQARKAVSIQPLYY
jgi:DNA-binding response OmpR family regulator